LRRRVKFPVIKFISQAVVAVRLRLAIRQVPAELVAEETLQQETTLENLELQIAAAVAEVPGVAMAA
jgi:hypothetical protein